MPARRAVLVLVLFLTACGSSMASGTHPTGPGVTSAAPPCGPASAHTLASDTSARIYSSGSGVYGCARHGHGSYRLGSSGRSIREGRVGPVAVSGVNAAYGLASFGVDTGSSQVIVRRLTDGRRLKVLAAVTKPQGPESYTSVGSIAAKADGAVAWIGTGRSIIGRGGDTEVHRADGRGEALLDSGTGIEPGSLRLRGSRLTWGDGAATRSASLL